LPSLANLLGAQCTPLQVERMVDSGNGARNQVINALQFDWNPEIYYVYPIPPRIIPSQTLEQAKARATKLHAFYKQGILCDVTIQAKGDDIVIKCHSLVLSLNGGEVIHRKLTQSWADSKATIEMKEFSKKTIEIFLEFIYLRKEVMGITNLTFADLKEPLALAYTYRVKEFIDYCTNAISLLAEPKDASEIGAMANNFQNQHLRNLAVHLAAHPKAVPAPKGQKEVEGLD